MEKLNKTIFGNKIRLISSTAVFVNFGEMVMYYFKKADEFDKRSVEGFLYILLKRKSVSNEIVKKRNY
jgi:hypothetical protein